MYQIDLKFFGGDWMRERIEKNIFERVERTLYAQLLIFESEKVCFSIKKQGSLFFENSFGGEDGCQARLKNGRGTCNVLKLSHESWFW